MLEFLIVLPLLLGLVAAGLEFSRSLRYYQSATALSRELTNIAYRECANRPPLDTMVCLERVRAPLQIGGSKLVQGLELVVSMYEFDEPTGTYRRLGVSPLNASTGASGVSQTKFAIAGGTTLDGVAGALTGTGLIGRLNQTTLQRHRVVAIGEAFVPYSPVIRMVLGTFSAESGILYDAAIL